MTGAWWLTDPLDGTTHAYRYTLPGYRWVALCGRVSDSTGLIEPETDFNYHIMCRLALAMLLADERRAG